MAARAEDRREYTGPIQSRAARRALAAALGAVTLLYLSWRSCSTLPGGSPGEILYGLIFLCAELLLAWLSLSFFAHLCEGTRRAPPPPPPAAAAVDVLIPTADEDAALVRRTAAAALRMAGSPRVWICDDGGRPELEALAGALGCGYLRRPDRRHFKAGNLNRALAATSGELVLVLDADHVPRRALLERTLGYFADPEVAFVQIPQVHYSVESFQHAPAPRVLYHENALFHHALQGGAEARGAVLFVGTGAIFRRSALESIGGFAEGSITEDVHTSMRLHAAGWRGVFVDEALAFLSGPHTPAAFARQRLRWARGAMQILRRENPLWVRGLSPWQRLAYFNAMAGWLAGPATLVVWATPAIFLLTGLSPVAAPAALALPIFSARIAAELSVYLLLTWPHGRLLRADCFRLMIAPLASLAALTLLRPEGLRFEVTPKGRHGGLPLLSALPLAALAALNLSAVAVGADAMDTLYAVHGTGAPVLLSALLIAACGYFAAASLYGLLFAWERRDSEGEPPLPVDLPAEVAGAPGARIARLGPERAWLLAGVELPEGAAVTARVPCPAGPPLALQGRTGACVRTGGGWAAPVALRPLSPVERDRLDTFLFEIAVPGFLASFPHGPRVHDAGPTPAGAATSDSYLPLAPELL